jgi:DHA1 family bicyclomycin/chloramphenicol resistance-like MFS transporter
VVLLGSLTALPPLAIDAYLPSLPSLALELSTTPAAAQVTLTAVLFGLAFGQLLIGPVSDRRGRRQPLLVGLATFVLASALCALAPNVQALVALRLLQGVAGGACLAVVRAVVRDQADGAVAARAFARLMLVMGVAPVAAPLAGAQLLRLSSWRGIFLALTAVALVLLAGTAYRLPETLPPARRSARGLTSTMRAFRDLIADRSFLGHTIAGALSFAAMFAYISASPFLLQELYGLSPTEFGLAFGANAAGLIALSQISARLVGLVGPGALLLSGLAAGAAGGAALLLVVLLDAQLPLVLAALLVVVSSVGLVAPNATTLALSQHGEHAGSASALLGLLQFTAAAVAAPLTALVGTGPAVALGLVVCSLTAGAAASGWLAASRVKVPLAPN